MLRAKKQGGQKRKDGKSIRDWRRIKEWVAAAAAAGELSAEVGQCVPTGPLRHLTTLSKVKCGFLVY